MSYKIGCDCEICRAQFDDMWDECCDRAEDCLALIHDSLSNDQYEETVSMIASEMMVLAGYEEDLEPHTQEEAEALDARERPLPPGDWEVPSLRLVGGKDVEVSPAQRRR
jgi:hypothetical protein